MVEYPPPQAVAWIEARKESIAKASPREQYEEAKKHSKEQSPQAVKAILMFTRTKCDEQVWSMGLGKACFPEQITANRRQRHKTQA